MMVMVMVMMVVWIGLWWHAEIVRMLIIVVAVFCICRKDVVVIMNISFGKLHFKLFLFSN